MRRKYERDCGIDLELTESGTVGPHEWAIFMLEEVDLRDSEYQALVIPRHSTFAMGLLISTSLIDSGFCGRPQLQVYNMTNERKIVRKHDYLCQMLFIPRIVPDGVETEMGARKNEAENNSSRP